jgi:hypothetical protein
LKGANQIVIKLNKQLLFPFFIVFTLFLISYQANLLSNKVYVMDGIVKEAIYDKECMDKYISTLKEMDHDEWSKQQGLPSLPKSLQPKEKLLVDEFGKIYNPTSVFNSYKPQHCLINNAIIGQKNCDLDYKHQRIERCYGVYKFSILRLITFSLITFIGFYYIKFKKTNH